MAAALLDVLHIAAVPLLHSGMRKDRGRVMRRDRQRTASSDRDKVPRVLERRTAPPQDKRRHGGGGGASRAGKAAVLSMSPEQVWRLASEIHTLTREDKTWRLV